MIIPSLEGRTLTKGHGAGNDFVLVPDFDGHVDLSVEDVRAVCDRHRGIGADGLIRVIRSRSLPEGAQSLREDPQAEWFMDYRNADGSIAEMCGNGVRVFVHYLRVQGIIDLPVGETVAIATRGGVKRVSFDGTLYTVDMGAFEQIPTPMRVQIAEIGEHAGASIAMPNPHVVVVVSEDELATADFTREPRYSPALPEGTNLEIVVPGPVSTMRVLERGVGETLACGTGTCAVAVAVLSERGETEGVVDIDSPGGRLSVEISHGSAFLTGPAVLVAEVMLLGLAGR